ncbi:MAG: ABC transporter substrate-binding protein [Eubacteriales bacterium]
MSKKLSALLFTCFLVFVLSLQVSAQIEITVWHSLSMGYGQEVIEEKAAEFNELHDDIQVEIVYSGGYQETLQGAQAALAAGDPPNISMFEQSRGAAFVDAQALEPLGSYFDRTEDLSFDDFFPAVRETAIYNGTIYGIPYNTSTPLLYYNKELFEEAGLEGTPETWDDLLDYSYTLKEELDVYGIDFFPWGWMFEAWTGQNGAEILNEDNTKFIFNSPEAVEAMKFTQDMVHKHDVAIYGEEGDEMFLTGQLGMIQRSTAALKRSIQMADFELGVAVQPYNTERYVPIGGANFFMFDTGTQEEKDASWEFLTYLIQAENFAEFAIETGYMAAKYDAYESELLQQYFEEEPRAYVTYEQLAYAHPRPKVPFWGEVHSELGWLFDQMFVEQADVSKALDSVVETGNRLMRVYGLSQQ